MITTHGFAVQSATSPPAPFDIEITSFGKIEEAWKRKVSNSRGSKRTTKWRC
jgi:hypothetical protein